MRIIAGTKKGLTIELPKQVALRPTSSRVREAIFSALQNVVDIEGSVVVDLYAGSGALGLEALSRGARFAYFVEQQKRLCGAIAVSVARMGFGEVTKIVNSDVHSSFVKFSSDLPAGTRIVFADPPYESHPGDQLLEQLAEYGVITFGSIIVVESGKALGLSAQVACSGNLLVKLKKCKNYGDTRVWYYQANTQIDSEEL